eukprot:TRINITY_DN10385_c1_g1_i1.p1 TRINITY_DN10385_c1_g1~~TRINITY_DN10385_c1_g1_i1.p1  ORF type:complete len:333 (+),score=82.23 TRINITY_DN10385_c1_g1_i1:143-1000(+)
MEVLITWNDHENRVGCSQRRGTTAAPKNLCIVETPALILIAFLKNECKEEELQQFTHITRSPRGFDRSTLDMCWKTLIHRTPCSRELVFGQPTLVDEVCLDMNRRWKGCKEFEVRIVVWSHDILLRLTWGASPLEMTFVDPVGPVERGAYAQEHAVEYMTQAVVDAFYEPYEALSRSFGEVRDSQQSLIDLIKESDFSAQTKEEMEEISRSMSKLPTYIRRARGISVSFRNSMDTMKRIERKLQKLQKKQKKEEQKKEEQRQRKEREEAEWLEASIVCEPGSKKQ